MDHTHAAGQPVSTVRRLVRFSVAAMAVALATACTKPTSPAADTAATDATLRPIHLPSLQGMAESVAEQLTERHSAVERERVRIPPNHVELARAYGELGKVLLGANYLDAAEPALRNAATLDPADVRWPYYLAHLHRERGDVPEATKQFERVLQLRAADVPALVWLASLYLNEARDEAAEPLIQRALGADPQSVAALHEAGRLALARRDYRTAVRRFEAALALDPTATAIHYPLAMAFRGLGDAARAERHLSQRSRDNRVVAPVDPLMRELEQSVAAPLALEARGVEALNRRDWVAAAEAFRQGTALAPRSAPLHHRLGTALVMMGRTAEAQREFETAISVAPGYAKAHYSLGLLLEDRGDEEGARAKYTAAVKSAPAYAAARVRLADLLRRRGNFQEALAEYDRASEDDPTLSDAPLGRALALAGLGRYAEARDQLTAGMTAFPEHTGFPHALARLLAAAPDDRVRDGRRALAVIENVLKSDRSTEAGEALAMALAELGRFGEAAGVQRDLIAAARRAGDAERARALAGNLRLYDARQPSRTMWRNDEVGQIQ